MAHLKRHAVPKNWPVPRKGTTFVVKPLSGDGIPLLVVLRDMLKVTRTRREVKKAIHLKNILINNKPAREEKLGLTLFDTVTLVPAKKSYRVELDEKGKYTVVEIKDSEANNKIAKVINKKVLKGKKVQLNLSDGRNFLSDVACNTNDSVVIDFTKKKVDSCIPLKEKSPVVVFAGKHAGEKGTIVELMPERKMAKIDNGKEKANILIKQLIVVK